MIAWRIITSHYGKTIQAFWTLLSTHLFPNQGFTWQAPVEYTFFWKRQLR